MTAAAAAKPDPVADLKKAQQKTEYVILKRFDADIAKGKKLWEEVEVERAPNDKAAVKQHTKKPDGSHAEGVWKAVPVRNWEGATTIKNETKVVSNFQEG